MKKLLYCWLVAVATVSCASKQSQETVIHLKTDQTKAEIVNLDPLSYWDIYHYTSGSLDSNKQVNLSCLLPCPLLAEVKVEQENGRIIQDIPVYLTPSAQVEVHLEGRKATFTGDLAQENSDLQTIYPSIEKLDRPHPKADSICKALEDYLKGKKYRSNFKKDILEAIHLRMHTHKLKNPDAETEEYLPTLLKGLKTPNAWLSLHTWPQVMAEFFMQCERKKLVEKSQAGLEKRLEYVNNEEIRSWYAVYALDKYIRSRIWFGSDPHAAIDKTLQYITVDAAKKEVQHITRQAEQISNDPKWKRSLEAPATDFCFEGLDGKMVSLSDYRGHFVIVDIWNVYCSVCIKQAPYMQRLEPELAKMDVYVLGVSTDDEILKDKWKATIKEKNIPGTQVIMARSKDRGPFFKNYYMPYYPVYCLIDPEGNILHACLPLPETPDFMATVKEKVEAYHNSKKKSDIPA